MIAPTRSASASDRGLGRGRRSPGEITVTVTLATAPLRPSAEPPDPRRLAGGLERLLTDGATLATPARALAAARAFAAGSGFLPGQIIDRAI